MAKATFILFLFLLTSSLAWAYQPPDLSQHGSNLKNASFPVKFKFEQKLHKDWSESTYTERKKFLTYWYEEMAKQKKILQLQKKEESLRAREIANLKKSDRDRAAFLAKNDEKQKIEEHKDKRRSKKKIDQEVKTMEKEIETLQKKNSL